MDGIYMGDIVRKSNFRSQFNIQNVVVFDNLTIAAGNNGFQNGTTELAEISGFTPIGVIGWYFENATTNGTGTTWPVLFRLMVSRGNPSSLHYGVRNTGTGQIIVKLRADVLYVRNS